MRNRRANSRVLGRRTPVWRSSLSIARTICVTSCSRIGTSLACEIQKRMRLPSVDSRRCFESEPRYHRLISCNAHGLFAVAVWHSAKCHKSIEALAKALVLCSLCDGIQESVLTAPACVIPELRLRSPTWAPASASLCRLERVQKWALLQHRWGTRRY